MSKYLMILTAGAISLGVAATDAQAKRGPEGGPRASFETLDTDSNGQITQAELDAHRAAQFAERDTNGDGKLTADEMAMEGKDRQAKRIEKMIERLDANDDGGVSLEEMAEFKPRRGGEKGMMRFDTNEDGMISKAEFDEASAKMGERGHGKKKNKNKN